PYIPQEYYHLFLSLSTEETRGHKNTYQVKQKHLVQSRVPNAVDLAPLLAKE
uniref:Uncharacterized protein n=1 Tax=Oryza brachyantha TaxID=4533 RepID=J3MYW9_ORYBR